MMMVSASGTAVTWNRDPALGASAYSAASSSTGSGLFVRSCAAAISAFCAFSLLTAAMPPRVSENSACASSAPLGAVNR